MNSLLTWQTVLAVVIIGVAVALSFRNDRRLAFVWAFLLPIDYVTGIEAEVFDAARYLGVVWVLVRVRPTLDPTPRRTTRHVALVMVALALVRGAMAVLHGDGNGMQFAGVLLLATFCAYMVAQRTTIHRAVTMGFVAGLALSAIVAVMQVLQWPTLRAGNISGSRYPGLSTYTMLFTWHLAFGLIISAAALVFHWPRRGPIFWASLGLLILFALTSVSNGAQGGLLGLAAAAVAFSWTQRRRLTVPAVGRLFGGVVAVVVVVAAAAALTQIEVPTVTGIGENDFRNERARVQVIYDGIDEFRDHPITGVSRTEFIERYNIAPHFLPVDSAAVAGVVALALSVYLLVYLALIVFRGPADNRVATVAGFMLLAAMVSNTLTDSYGPFVGVSRATPLFLALVATAGHWAGGSTELDAQAPMPELVDAPGGGRPNSRVE